MTAKRKPVSVSTVAIPSPFPRCSAPGCGDKIKVGTYTTCHHVTFDDGSTVYVEHGCMEWFVNGHPDYGHGHGPIEGFEL